MKYYLVSFYEPTRTEAGGVNWQINQYYVWGESKEDARKNAQNEFNVDYGLNIILTGKNSRVRLQ